MCVCVCVCVCACVCVCICVYAMQQNNALICDNLYILKYAAKIGALSKYGCSLLHFACMGGSKQTVQYLVEDLKLDIGEFLFMTTSMTTLVNG